MRAKTLVTCATNAPQNGITFEDLNTIDDGAMLCADGRIVELGTRVEVESRIAQFREKMARVAVRHGRNPADFAPDMAYGREIEVLDVPDGILVPGFVDAHAHPLFAGDREPDFVAKLRGEPAPLGMQYTIAQTRKALESPEAREAFWRRIEERLRRIAAHGTTTLEVKTGYALHKEGETQLLDLIDAHKETAGLPRLIATFLGAHACPPEFPTERAYVDYLIAHVVPVARAHGAIYADAFCEPGFFSPSETARYLQSCREHGMHLRVHCDEMAYGGAAAMAAELDVDAIDHANCITEADVEAIVEREIAVVACPATISYLGLMQRAPVRSILERGGRVALASDYNPGTSPCFNLQTVAYFGRTLFGLSAAEALDAVTRSAARSLNADAGVLHADGPADFVVLDLESPDEFGWQFGGNVARCVVRAGEVVV